MKKFFFLLVAFLGSHRSYGLADDHAHHAKHNMVLFGHPGAFYASHIVYRQPHNFQIILRVFLDSASEEKIAAEMRAHADQQFIYLLDHMDIREIQNSPTISGQIFIKKKDGSKKIILEAVTLKPGEYAVIYFNELPLSLGQDEGLYVPAQTARL